MRNVVEMPDVLQSHQHDQEKERGPSLRRIPLYVLREIRNERSSVLPEIHIGKKRIYSQVYLRRFRM